MNHTSLYNEYSKYVKTFESFLYEAKVEDITDGKKVVIFPGRFQPFHNGHLAALKRASEEFGVPVIPLQILSAREESPFPDSLLNKIGKDVVKANSYIADYFIYPPSYGRTVIPFFVRFLREKGYEPIGIACGADRFKDYIKQIEYITGPKTDTKVDPNFTIKMVDAREGDGPSGTKVRAALKSDDEAAYKKLMSKELWKYYKELQNYIK